MTFYDWERGEFREAEIIDRNGQLLYVEDEEGNREWIDEFEIQSEE